MTRRGEHVCWAIAGACGLIVALWAALATAPSHGGPAPVGSERLLFDSVVADEAAERTRALEEWPSHRWSQEDAFGAMERDKAHDVAAGFGLTTQDALRALDEGMRRGWPLPDGTPLRGTVTPLQPRPMD